MALANITDNIIDFTTFDQALNDNLAMKDPGVASINGSLLLLDGSNNSSKVSISNVLNLRNIYEHKSVSIISPLNTDKVGIWYVEQSNLYFFNGARYFIRGSSPSISFNILTSATRTGTTTTLASVTSGTSTAGASFGTASGTALGNVHVWIEVTAVGGTVDELWVQLNFSTISPV